MKSLEDLYSKVSNRQGVWNSRSGWKKYQKLIVGGIGIVGGLEKTANFNSREGGWEGRGVGWLLNCFFLSFSNH